jgi:hypothetical protein
MIYVCMYHITSFFFFFFFLSSILNLKVKSDLGSTFSLNGQVPLLLLLMLQLCHLPYYTVNNDIMANPNLALITNYYFYLYYS